MDEKSTEPTGPSYTPLLRGDHVFLRPAERSDLPTFVRWFADADMSSLLGNRAPFSEAGEELWFSRMLEQQGKDVYGFVMCRLDDGTPFGTITLMHIDRDNGSAGVGIAIGDKSMWGKGYGTDAMRALLDFGFGELRLERIWLDVYDFNKRARRSYEKAGFSAEGVQRHAHYSEGKYQDVVLMSILRHEWQDEERKKTWDYRQH